MSVNSGDVLVRRSVQGAVLVISLARPPVNALDARLLADLSRALADANADPAITAIVLSAEGDHFSAGLDLSELGRVKDAALPGVCAQIDAMRKSVIAAIAGNVLGGGMELILACHARVAHAGARLGLPEVALGLPPCGGGTQRLPRLVGAQVALKMLLEGMPLSAAEALAVGILDKVVETAPLKDAVKMATELAGKPPRRSDDRRDGMRDPQAYQAAIREARARVEGVRLPAPARLVDCVEAAALLPYESGLAFEFAAFEDLATTPEALGLRHAFLAERRGLFPPSAVAAIAPPRLSSVAVLGASGPAPEVVRMALSSGLHVTLVEPDRATLVASLEKIAARQTAMVADGSLTVAARDAEWARLKGVLASEGLEGADLILTTPDAPRMAAHTAPVVALGGKGALVLHPATGHGGLAELSVNQGVPPAQTALALAFGRKLSWRVMVQGPGMPLDQRLRACLSRAIAHLEMQGCARATIAATLASYGLGAGGRAKLPKPPEDAGDILGFCLAAMINEGAKLVAEGVARRPIDVDAAALLSGLFPRWQGGPMYQADQIGLMALRADLRARTEGAPNLCTPSPLIDTLIHDGKTFADLNRR